MTKLQIISIGIAVIIGILAMILIEPDNTYTTVCNVDRIEDGKIVLITQNGYRIIVDSEIMPELTEGEIINIEYTIDINATAELTDRIETLQTTLLNRSQ